MYEGNALKQQAAYGVVGGAAGQVGAIGQMDGQRKPELVVQMDRLEQAINFAEDSLARLRDRLDNGAMRPDAPTTNMQSDAKLATAPPVSGYANTAYQRTERVGALATRIGDLLRRLEV